jgi:hypothetical protein
MMEHFSYLGSLRTTKNGSEVSDSEPFFSLAVYLFSFALDPWYQAMIAVGDINVSDRSKMPILAPGAGALAFFHYSCRALLARADWQ